MDYTDYYNARKLVVDIMKKDLLGPVQEDEVIEELPLDYYILGKLYPQKSFTMSNISSTSEDIGNLDDEDIAGLDNGKNPSSFGLSISVNPGVHSIKIKVNWAKYIPETEKTTEGKEITKWLRKCLKTDWLNVDLSNSKRGECYKEKLDDYLSVHVFIHKKYNDGSMTVSVSLVNDYCERTNRKEENQYAYFQPQIKISSDSSDAFGDVRRNVQLSNDDEISELNMLYSEQVIYASGHGCAVYDELDNNNRRVISTDFMPEYQVLQMMPSSGSDKGLFSMKYLSTVNQETIINQLNDWNDKYRLWINKRKQEAQKLPHEFHESADKNLSKCEDTYERIKLAIECLYDNDVYKAFQLANLAMYMQRKQMTNAKDEDICWYPFQLAFFLQELISFAEPKNENRDKVDLLWFPTGGGKTEAYLGIAAFVIFYRRITKKELGAGVAVIMRYTMRLLTFQQFERAAAMICACEIIRNKYNIPGGEIGIGLWAGLALTPNKLENADKILKGIPDPIEESSNPKQFEKCPWCHAELTDDNYSVDMIKHRMHITCSKPKCAFHKGIPVYLIDEEIYYHKPTYIVATVDKFAQVALNEDTFSLFGDTTNFIPPELIIQDELHLISGPLGTITGIYEAAFKRMCEYKGIPAKIVASTATIRNAKEQILALYASDYSQFPPQGLSVNDSYFAIQSTEEQRPGRLYVGCMATGTSPTTMMIRVMASMLFATRYLTTQGFSDEVVDSFWTLTGYFNTLRELGGAIIRVIDDIQDRYKYLKETKMINIFPLENAQERYANYKELTSREKSENIGNVIQNKLQIKFSSTKETAPYDFLLSSNMISVGIDIARLGAMVVVGQPKASAEYIQATSRVGRNTPGLVVTTYNQMKSRDRSHYEQFYAYHGAFYKYVEATSVTPFADRARDRALQTLFVVLCRYYIPELRSDSFAINFNRNLNGIDKIKDYILNYVDRVDPDEYENVEKEIEEIIQEWDSKARKSEILKYRNNGFDSSDNVLFDDECDEMSRFRVLNSMRSVETTIDVIVRE